jgi:hypothetical protein
MINILKIEIINIENTFRLIKIQFKFKKIYILLIKLLNLFFKHN